MPTKMRLKQNNCLVDVYSIGSDLRAVYWDANKYYTGGNGWVNTKLINLIPENEMSYKQPEAIMIDGYKKEEVPTFTMLIGIPGSGKSTLANSLEGDHEAFIISSDEIRIQMYGIENLNKLHNSTNTKVFSVMEKQAKKCLNDGVSVIYDATNIVRSNRMNMIKALSGIQCKKRCIIVATPYSECLKRNMLRDKVVPESVIKNMYRSFSTPAYFEGFDLIDVYFGDDDEFRGINGNADSWINDYRNYEQGNPHHSLTLGEHVRLASKIYPSLATKLHDIGKPFCRGDRDGGGYNYHGHQCVGAYDTLFFDYPVGELLEASILVNLHMVPHQWDNGEISEKKILEQKTLYGYKLTEQLIRLHEADVAAH